MGKVIADLATSAASATFAVENATSSVDYVLSGTDGSANDHLKTDGSGNLAWVTPTGGLFSGYAIFADQKTQGTNGGTFTSGAWRQRDINTTVANTDTTNITLGTNEFTLLAGNYLIRWDVAAYTVYQNITRLYDGTSSVGQGLSSNSNTWGTPGSARVTPGTSTTYEIQHWCDTTLATYGFGLQAGFSTEQYLTVEIYKES